MVTEAEMADRQPADRLISFGLVILLLAVGSLSFHRALRGRYDFHHFYLDARYVWTHGALNPVLEQVMPDHPDADVPRQLPFYLPVVPLVLAPLSAFGQAPAALIWAALQVAALGYSLRSLRRWGAEPGQAYGPAVPFVVTVLLALPAINEATRFNQVSYFVLVLVLAGMTALEARRSWLAGVLLAGAVLLKLLPGIFLVWLLLKRRWQAAGALVAATVVIGLVPCLVVFGPAETWTYHQQWWEHNRPGQATRFARSEDATVHFIDRRNQSMQEVVARLTWPEHPRAAAWQPVELSESAGRWVALGVLGGLFAGFVWWTRRSWDVLSLGRRRAEMAAYAVGMLVFSPLLRQYYLVWALPAILVLALVGSDERGGWRRRVGQAGLFVWLAGMVAWIWPVTRVYGAHLAMLFVVGVLVLTGVGTEARRTDGGMK
jgi:alpha-1,2-mannosyltransferase